MNNKWVAGWGCASNILAQSENDHFSNQTFRYVLFNTLKGSALRFHFSNYFAEEDCIITKATVAKSNGDRDGIVLETLKILTFNGKESVTLQAGLDDLVSDAVEMEVAPGEEVAISLYFKEMTASYTGHTLDHCFTKKFYGKGDHASAEHIPLEVYGTGGSYHFVNTMDVLTSEDCYSIVCFGDSITAQPWPDHLAHNLFENGINNCAVVRRAIGGNRVLRDYKYRSVMRFGKAGIKRFLRDVGSVTGAKAVVVLEGINDLLHPREGDLFCPMEELPKSANEVIEGYKKYIEIAHSLGLKIYFATVIVSPMVTRRGENRNEMRKQMNEWIRTNTLADGFIEFDKALANPENPEEILEIYDSGDNLHPSHSKGQQRFTDPEFIDGAYRLSKEVLKTLFEK